jgi:ABC-type polysaccharide/polyol phosphate export permease
MSPYVAAYQDIFYYQRWPDLAIWATAIGYAGGAAAIGLWLIVRNEDHFAEQV